MIRQSHIEDGKIIIPPAGLVYFENGGEYYGPLNGEPTLIAGESAVWIEMEEALAVKKKFLVPFDQRPLPLGEEGTIALQYGYYTDNYFGAKAATLRFVFSNGHAGWDKRVVFGASEHRRAVSDVSAGYVDQEGMTTPPPIQYFGNPYDAHSSIYISIDDIQPGGILVKEVGAPEANWFKISYTQPIVTDWIGVGQTVTAGKYRVKVLGCNRAEGMATVALTDDRGNVLIQKALGPLTLETYKIKNYVHHSMPMRHRLVMDYDNVRVQLNTKYDTQLRASGPTNLFDENGKLVSITEAENLATFSENGVSLVIYTDIEKIPLRKPWEKDPNFVFQTHYI